MYIKRLFAKKEPMDYLADFGGWLLFGAMFIYLGYRTLHFLGFTFSEEDQIYSYLGLFSTTIGAVIFGLMSLRCNYFDHRAKVWRVDAFRQTVSRIMMVVCALGELGLAFADMSLVTAQRQGTVIMTEGELVTYMWLTAGLASAVAAAVGAIKLSPRHPSTDPIVDMSDVDADNNGIIDPVYEQSTPPAPRLPDPPPAPRLPEPEPEPLHRPAPIRELVMRCMECGKPTTGDLFCSVGCERDHVEKTLRHNQSRLEELNRNNGANP